MHTILIADDEEPMRELLKVHLIGAGYQVDEAKDGMEALEKLRKNSHYSALILDWMMPFMDGMEVIKRVREFSSIPILMLTARNETEEKVKGFLNGADDYVTKPFESAELLARIQALLRRGTSPYQETDNRLMYNGLAIDQGSRTARFQGNAVSLTQSEFDLLVLFVKHPKQIFSRTQLIDQVWGADFEGDERTVDSHIRNLRGKLKSIGAKDFIKTVWGMGYQFV
ncbi:response regulator transcription factor [Cohnella algarum]|uniref:response regulator transcription factor n=1 Tax=Cohnella algarum TaxID=2044859 RepID=UPI0019681A83|nr:response regulator transcription factor [Cohnella algarum]MBN2981758.1 response regulator transcription factor [Cohnella algarum]